MPPILLSRDEALDVLSALDEAAGHAVAWGVLTLLLVLEDAVRLLHDRLYPDLPPAT